ncbi:hypothetical protein SCLCIDRAFT_28080 [Scleroderma citrinum Foug A]|uniref:Uncharacterized protein n=1 Tax=Scleroderma citrinum Foug A TaxID=1036808 RepID=A0A0C3DQZ4_9AGAM|nr:hypothetical protein SCLCIDRAFT_28080 [Scleroderma citrinum Foug A]
MSAPSKNNTPTPTTATQSKDWMKAATPELNTGMDDETEARLAEQERQHKEREEAEHKAKEEAKHKAKEEAERKVAEER